MRKLQLRTLILGIILSVMILMGFPGNRLARAADPDFGTVTDILGGQRHLLRDDDLLVTADLPPTYGTVTLHTKDLQVVNQIASTVVSNTCSMPFPAPRPRQTRIGRLVALPNDVISHPSSHQYGDRFRL